LSALPAKPPSQRTIQLSRIRTRESLTSTLPRPGSGRTASENAEPGGSNG
jgi:hypothetical protein